jgi:glutathione S-transferase
MTDATLYGPSYSSYTRVARMALAQKGVPYDLVEVDYVFSGQNTEAEHLVRHPFGKLPVLDHAGFVVYEATAVTRYVDDAFPGPALQPEDAEARAHMNQVIGIVDSYVTPLWMLDIVMRRLVDPMIGVEPDEVRIAGALDDASIAAHVLDGFLAERDFCAGETVSLADFFLFPQHVYASMTPEMSAIFAETPNLTRWAADMAKQPAARTTEYPDLST